METSFKDMIREDLIIMEMEGFDNIDVLTKISNILYEKNIVTKEYLNSLLDREQKYPTGLHLGEVNIAIPHSSYQFVNEQAIVLAILKNPVGFYSMDGSGFKIAVRIVLCLAMDKDNTNINILPELIKFFIKKKNIQKILLCKNSKDILNSINK